VSCGGGIAALRALQGAMEQDGVRKRPYADVVARDLRITLGQLTPELRETVRKLRVFGGSDDFDRFADDLASRSKSMGLEVELVRTYPPAKSGMRMPSGTPVSPAVSLAARFLAGQGAEFEFLPPKVSAWKQFSNRYSSGKLAWTGAAVGVAAVVVALAFGIQQWQLVRWQTKWGAIKPRVTELEKMQDEIRRFRPWFDDSFRTLSILRRLTEAFPEDGAVSAKRVEIRDPAIVTCSGVARDINSALKVRNQLLAMKEVSDMQMEQFRGKTPVQFSFHFRWTERANP
jgi:hypothetical protein